MYRFENVRLKFKNKVIFNNFSYSFNNKGLYYIVGPTGCGKTTMLRLMLLNKIKYSGNIYFNEENIKSLNNHKIELIRNDITYIGVKNQAFKDLSLKDNLRILLNDDYDKEKAVEILEKYDLTKYLNKKIKELSMGERQRFLLIIPLLKKSKIVLIDEGFSNLDRKYSNLLTEEYEKLSKTSLVIMVEHILENIKSGNIIDFNNLESNDLKVEKCDLILKTKNAKLKIFDYLKIYKKEILINLLLYFILIILSSVLISGAYSKKIDDDELEAMSLRALPTDTIFIDETRIDPSDYNIKNKISYFDEVGSKFIPDIMEGTFICSELNINGKKTKLKDGYIYTARNLKNKYWYANILKQELFNFKIYKDNSDMFNESHVEYFTNCYDVTNFKYNTNRLYPIYNNIKYMNYNTLRMTYPFQCVLIEYETNVYSNKSLCSEKLFDYSNTIPGLKIGGSFEENDLLIVYDKDKNEKVNFYNKESKKYGEIDLSSYASKPLGKSTGIPRDELYCDTYPFIILKNEIFEELIYNKKLTFGDYVFDNYAKTAYQLSDNSDVIGLVKENKRRIASGEEPIYKIMSYSNLEYKINTFKLTRSANDYLNNVGFSGVIVFILLILMNLKKNNTKVLLNHDYKKNKIFIFNVIENIINCCLLFGLSIICTRIYFKTQYQTIYLQIESNNVLIIYSLIISEIIIFLNSLKNYLEIKECFKAL